ncbi:MAG: hypothetical protein JXA16_14195 [Bacteroidales bacterium]|nr:hypothetical protein [Bacteroidales bacterium]
MKNTVTIIFLLIFAFQVNFAQQTVEKIEYWDYFETQKKKVWHELGDGTWHGDVKFYKQNGILEYHVIMNYGKIKEKTWYFQDGSVMIKINNNEEGIKNGIQELYNYSNGIRFLKAWADISNDVVKEYKCYYKKDVLKFTYTFDGFESIFKRYDEDGTITFEVKTKNGIVSDITDYYGITIKNNRFEKVGINVLSSEIKDGKYYVYSDRSGYEQKKYVYYKIPEKHYFQLKPIFNYSDNYGLIEFDLDLYLQIKKDESYSFSLILNNSDYDDNNKWDYSVGALRYYFNELLPDGVYKSYDVNNGNCYEIFYDDGKETWKKNYYHDGTLKNYANGDTLMEYNEDGKLVKETIADDFRVFDTEGKVIDSKEIRENYNTVLEEYNNSKEKYNTINDATNDIIKNDFCIDLSSGHYINQYQCYNKDNESIGEAFKILHLDYIAAWKALIPEYERLKNIENSLPWRSNSHFIEKTDVLKGYTAFYNQNLSLIDEFTITIEKFKELMNTTDIKKINKSLKKASTSNEIKTIVGL